MLLMAILADYTGIYHSTTEILQVYAEESSFIKEKYNLGMNDTEYIRDLMIKVGIDVEAAPTAAAATQAPQLRRRYRTAVL
jgi:spore coat protein CotF